MYRDTRGFTLVEVLVASALAIIIMGGIITLFLTSIETWKVGAAEVKIERNGSLALEKMVRGSGGTSGLREANPRSVVIYAGGAGITFSVDKNDPPTSTLSDDTTVRIYFEAENNNLIYDPDVFVANDEFIIVEDGSVAELNFSKTGDVIDINVRFFEQVTPRGRSVDMQFNTSVALRKS